MGLGPQIVDPSNILPALILLPESLQPSLQGGLSLPNLITFILFKLLTSGHFRPLAPVKSGQNGNAWMDPGADGQAG